ncbi:MAG: DNA-3-methyladenine glycosylase [Parcubacteria group bacterium Athens0714_26]|nr:MAG: DNA-3-methyladenine glycosylase [Parcubacteria group bacterium Athens1014_26]TSD03100.1 MAG: DNA-3-methyladenine glycosylase [Parcubacteria group bacterium Athens0714_26]
MGKILRKEFFESKNTVKIARNLIGKFLARRLRGKNKAYMITEAEAYDGFKDEASHAHCGRTKRNEIMFGHAGCWYVYFTYGMHWMLNIVTGPEDYPAAILIRGIQSASRQINGPAKLTKALKINKYLNGKPADKKSGLWIEDRGINLKPRSVKSMPRVGVSYAEPVWSNKKYRFLI